ncbi:MAG: cupin domain-containing protein [bacterium]|nr:cupin domain-containing protein [bacterium]
MHIGHINDVEKEGLPIKGGEGAGIQWLIAEKQGADAFYMRLVTIEPGGEIPLHSHDVVHEMFILKGKGAVLTEEGENNVSHGNFAYIEGEKVHGFKNLGDEDFMFICCIDKPSKDSYK